jgi:hypothetical protein
VSFVGGVWGGRGGAALVVIASVLGASSAARAEAPVPSSLSVRVDYQGPPDCPTSSDFTARLTTRSPHLRLTPDDESAPKLVVRVTHGAHGRDAHGVLSIHYADGNQAKRTVDGDTCDSIVDALALMSAMALDPTVALGGPAPDAPPPAAPPTVVEPPVTKVADEDADRARRAVDLRQGVHLAMGLGGGVAFGFAPVAVPDVGAFVELAHASSGAWSPSVRAGFDYATSGNASVSGGGMSVVRSVGVLDACPLAWNGGPFRLSPCAVFEGGVLSARGQGVMPTLSPTRPWLAAGALGRARYVFLSRVFVELTFGLRVPFVRDSFYFMSEPSTTIFRAPVISGFAGGALGLTIL